MLLTLLLALGCSKDEEIITEGEGEGGDQAMNPDGGEDMGLGDEGEFGGGGEGEFGGIEGGAPKKPKQPAIDPNAPAGKKQLWTYGSGRADIAKIYFGKTDKVLAATFGQPDNWKKQGKNVIYTYDKMRVKGAQNMQYSKVHFVVKPDHVKGGGTVTRVLLDPTSGVRIQPAGGFTEPGLGVPGEGSEGGGFEGNPGGSPARGGPGEPTPR